jgi:hypothetical protein
MPSIPVVNPLGYVGVFLVIAGLFLAIAGLDLIKIERLTITPGRKTWGMGLLLAVIGVLFLLPDIHSAINFSPTPTAIDTILPNATSPSPANTSANTTIIQPTSANVIPPAKTSTSISPALKPPTVASAPPRPIACVTSQSGSGVPVEVHDFGEGGLVLTNGVKIPFSSMKSFEVFRKPTSSSDWVTITLSDNDIVTEELDTGRSLLFQGTTKYGDFSIFLFDVKRVEFREQGGCQ